MRIMRLLSLCGLFSLLAAPWATWAHSQEPNATVQVWVEELKSLSPDASLSEFLNRPAMSRLMALGPAGYPALKDAFLNESHWAVKASAAYLVTTMVRNSDAEVTARLRALIDDNNVFVRATSVTLYRAVVSGAAFDEVLARPDVGAIADRLPLTPSLDWMSPADLSQLAQNALSVIEKGKPFLDPPTWETSIGRTSDRSVSRIRSAGLRVVTLENEIAERVFHRISDSLTLKAIDVHKTVDLLMSSLESETGSDQERLGRKLRIAEIVLGHQHPECRDGKCKDYSAFRERLYAACEKWALAVTDANALHAIESALTSIIGLEKAKALLENLKQNHPNPEMRDLVREHLEHYAERLSDEARELERRKTGNLQIERESGKAYPVRREKAPYIPPVVKTVPPPERGAAPEASTTGLWIFGGAIGLAILIAAVVYRRTQGRSAP